MSYDLPQPSELFLHRHILPGKHGGNAIHDICTHLHKRIELHRPAYGFPESFCIHIQGSRKEQADRIVIFQAPGIFDMFKIDSQLRVRHGIGCFILIGKGDLFFAAHTSGNPSGCPEHEDLFV